MKSVLLFYASLARGSDLGEVVANKCSLIFKGFTMIKEEHKSAMSRGSKSRVVLDGDVLATDHPIDSAPDSNFASSFRYGSRSIGSTNSDDV